MEALDERALALLLDGGDDGWGQAQRTTLGEHRLFVKAVPVTDRERLSRLTTANLYDIPPYLNYPFGSPGIGVGRELAFARRSTSWIASGATSGFPMLLHDRVIERGLISGDAGSSGGFTAYRGDDTAMNTYLADRASAPSCLVLVYEDVGANAVDWLVEHPADAGWIVDEVRSTLRFLRHHDVVHFDVDLFNVITDGRQAYIADHGLVIDGSFQLTDGERNFLAAHRHFDDGNLVMSLGHQLYWSYLALPIEEREMVARRLAIEAAPFDVAFQRLFDACTTSIDGPFDIDPTLRALVNRFRPVIEFMHGFYRRSRANWNEATKFDDLAVARLLAECDR